MKKEHQPDEVDEILPEYDFSKGVRGKYYERYVQGTNVILLDPDVAEVFKDSETVNRTLRAASEIIRINRRKAKARA